MAEKTDELRVRELFDQTVDLDEEGRNRVLGAEPDPAVVARVRALLRQDATDTISPLQRSMATARLPHIDKYELLRPLGEGGMGEVFLARQVEPVVRDVAVKLLRDIGSSPFATEWFERERQTLALMSHPGIAQIFDGGKTKTGEPYLVMELVRGEPITAYCERRRLPLAARLRLLEEVCDAVHHAHQKSVVHRDLKPDNVLVVELDGTPRCKVIDFGIARSLQATRAGSDDDRTVLGTWRYMSPEQRQPTGLGIDTRSDIYSLGVMLFELVGGTNPHADGPQAAGSARVETRREPGQDLAAGDSEWLRKRAASLGTTPRALLSATRPELDSITRKAMAEDRNDRYGSAAELRDDLMRLRRREPVSSMPATPGYVLRKFLQRRRAVALAAATAFASLLGAALGLGYGMLEAREAQAARADAHGRTMRQLTRAAAQLEFQDLVLFHLDPGTGERGSSLRGVLDLLAPSIAARFGANTQEEAGVRASLGHAYLAVGEPQKALPHLEQALEMSASELDNLGADAIALLNDAARANRLAGRAEVSASHLARLLEIGSRELQRSDTALAAAIPKLARLARTPGAEAQFLHDYDKLLAAVESMPRQSESARLLIALTGATGLLIADSNIASGPDLLYRIGAFLKSAYSDELDTMFPLVRLSERLLRLGSYRDAKSLAEQALQLLERLAADRHWMRLQAERIFGLATALDGAEAEGERMLVTLSDGLCDLPAEANEQARAAGAALGELCERLRKENRFDTFCEQSLQRWQGARDDNRVWWLACCDELPAFAHAAASEALRDLPASARTPRERAAIGSALLRSGDLPTALSLLESAAADWPEPPPELLADLVRATSRSGRKERAAPALHLLQEAATELSATPRERAAAARAALDFAR